MNAALEDVLELIDLLIAAPSTRPEPFRHSKPSGGRTLRPWRLFPKGISIS